MKKEFVDLIIEKFLAVPGMQERIQERIEV